MITLQLEVVGDRVGIILDEAARAALNAEAGDHVHLRRTPEGELTLERAGADYQDRHERSRAFLKRYRRSLDVYSSPQDGAAQP
ncbi:hypothetical protein [Phenylobacterium sp.]|uniref:hypothetical protein n=1 Tax=Phenylobacterium sp. TaxID=1871053 RepID=UPI002F42D321